MFAKSLVLLIIIALFGFSVAKTARHRSAPYTRLCYDAGGGTNIYFFSFMRCKQKVDEDFTYHRYRTIPANGKVFYENGGILDISGDCFCYLGITNSLSTASNYVLTPTTNHPNHFIRSFDR